MYCKIGSRHKDSYNSYHIFVSLFLFFHYSKYPSATNLKYFAKSNCKAKDNKAFNYCPSPASGRA